LRVAVLRRIEFVGILVQCRQKRGQAIAIEHMGRSVGPCGSSNSKELSIPLVGRSL
jgi:hypothetical protein